MNRMNIENPEALTPFELFLFNNLDALAANARGNYKAFFSFEVENGIPKSWHFSVENKDKIHEGDHCVECSLEETEQEPEVETATEPEVETEPEEVTASEG